jgi:hypothetical protein
VLFRSGIHNSNEVWIGARQVPDQYFAGYIDEVRIYNRILTADEIKQLYRMGAIPKGIK